MRNGPPSTDLTGLWHGVYSYAARLDSEHFIAELVDHGGRFEGTVSETVRLTRPVPVDLRADLVGTHSAGEVRFLKTYDGTGGWTHSVAYTGHLDAEGTEISGTWSVEALRGTFLMVRNPHPGVEERARQVERAGERR